MSAAERHADVQLWSLRAERAFVNAQIELERARVLKSMERRYETAPRYWPLVDAYRRAVKSTVRLARTYHRSGVLAKRHAAGLANTIPTLRHYTPSTRVH